MIRAEVASAADCGAVLPLFSAFNNPAISAEQWRSLFHYPWETDTEQRGFVLRDENRVVGFIGTIWSVRKIAGKAERFCNLSSWITLPEYRNHSLLLFKAVMELRDCTITCHTPAGPLYPLYRRFGFSDLEKNLRIIRPLPAWQGASTWLGDEAISDPDEIEPLLPPPEREILNGHRLPGCGHLLLRGRAGEQCYLVYTRTMGKRFPFAHVHYLGNPQVFARNLDRVRLHLMLTLRTPLIMIDARLVADVALPNSREVSLSVPHVFRSGSLSAAQIDNLYSELILLNL